MGPTFCPDATLHSGAGEITARSLRIPFGTKGRSEAFIWFAQPAKVDREIKFFDWDYPVPDEIRNSRPCYRVEFLSISYNPNIVSHIFLSRVIEKRIC